MVGRVRRLGHVRSLGTGCSDRAPPYGPLDSNVLHHPECLEEDQAELFDFLFGTSAERIVHHRPAARRVTLHVGDDHLCEGLELLDLLFVDHAGYYSTRLEIFHMRHITHSAVAAAALCLVGCPSEADSPPTRPSAASSSPVVAAPPPSTKANAGKSLTVHFYDVDQGLAALVELPDSRHVLVDAGDAPARMGCGSVCSASVSRLYDSLSRDLEGAPIDMLWITHQHSDHDGGVPKVASHFTVKTYVDNGRDVYKNNVAAARAAVSAAGSRIAVVDPDHKAVPLSADASYTVSSVLPASWPAACDKDANDCSIMLRIQFGSSSVLFTGDAEAEEEKTVFLDGPVTLLQVGHHGSNTSTSPEFLKAASPKTAVISAGHPHEGLNRTYCHPRASTVRALTAALGGPGRNTINSYEPVKCDDANDKGWAPVPAADSLWSTSRDGEVVLTTSGDGKFVRISTKKK